jgi:hypothetical protein
MVGSFLAVLSVAAASDDVGLPPRQSLVMLLTTESLIFAAFSISATLALPTPTGRALFFAQGRFAFSIVGVLAFIAVAGGFALCATLEPDPPAGINEWIRAAGIGVGIAAQPVLAWAVAKAAKDTKPGFKADSAP